MTKFITGLIKFVKRIITTATVLVVVAVALLFIVPLIEKNKYASGCPAGYSNSADWLATMPDGALLSNISIPGTHDSASVNSTAGMYKSCQLYSIGDQLNAGYRLLDICLRMDEQEDGMTKRFKLTKERFSCKKKPYPWSQSIYLDEVLRECYGFLDNHPSETILLSIKPDDENVNIKQFQENFREYIGPDSDRWLLTSKIPTLKEARGKIVLLRKYEDDASLGESAGIPFVWDEKPGNASGDYDYAYYENEGVGLWVQDCCEYDTEDKWKAFYKGFFSSPANGDEVFVNYLSTNRHGLVAHPFLYANTLNKRLLNMNKSQISGYGWTIVDFGDAELARYVYESNSVVATNASKRKVMKKLKNNND